MHYIKTTFFVDIVSLLPAFFILENYTDLENNEYKIYFYHFKLLRVLKTSRFFT